MTTDGSVFILDTDEARVFLWVDPGQVCDPEEDMRPGTVVVQVETPDPTVGWRVTDELAAPSWDRELLALMLTEAMEAAAPIGDGQTLIAGVLYDDETLEEAS